MQKKINKLDFLPLTITPGGEYNHDRFCYEHEICDKDGNCIAYTWVPVDGDKMPSKKEIEMSAAIARFLVSSCNNFHKVPHNPHPNNETLD